jgi:hypothetical protein
VFGSLPNTIVVGKLPTTTGKLPVPPDPGRSATTRMERHLGFVARIDL